MKDIYLTISKPAEGLFKEKGSKFLSFVHPVLSEAEAESILKDYRKKFYDARHVCYAFVLGPDANIFRYSDAGEPSNSAGPPIYGQIKSQNLTNVIVIVVRYFGGAKLGVSGLISAYKTAAAEALANSKIIKKYPETLLTLKFTYEQMNTVMKLVKDYDLKIMEQNFDLKCEMKVLCRSSTKQELINTLKDIDINA